MAQTRPVAGDQYVVQRDDTLELIATRAYGAARYASRIASANQITNNALVAGQVILIPLLPADESLRTQLTKSKLADKEKYDLTLLIGGTEVQPVAVRVKRHMDTAAAGWTATIDWEPGVEPAIDKLVVPYKYPVAAVYIGGTLLVNGLLYGVRPQLTAEGITVDLAGYSYSVDAVDSTVQPPYEHKNKTLQDVANLLIEPLGIEAEFEAPVGEAFKRVSASSGDTIFAVLAKYAAQRGVLVSCTETGNLLFWRAQTSDRLLGTLREGSSLVLDWAPNYDGRQLYNLYRVISRSPGRTAQEVTAVEASVPRARFKTIEADDTTKLDVDNVAEWHRSKQLAAALSLPISVSDWYAPNGELWQVNRRVNVISPTLLTSQGYVFLIRGVEFIQSSSGQTATLDLVPPQVYTGEAIAFPWG